MIIDMQKAAHFPGSPGSPESRPDGLVRIANASRNLLFGRVNEQLWKSAGAEVLEHMHNCADAYAGVLAGAIRHWAMQKAYASAAPCQVPVARDLTSLEAMTTYYYAGSTTKLGYNPLAHSQQTTRTELLCLKEDVRAGETVKALAFGQEYAVRVPSSARCGQMIQLELTDGSISARVIPNESMVAATAIFAGAAMAGMASRAAVNMGGVTPHNFGFQAGGFSQKPCSYNYLE